MKLLFVVSTLKMGGAERVCAILASKFSLSHEVSLVKFDEDKPFYELSSRVNLVNLAYGTQDSGVAGNFKKRFGKIFALRELIREGKFDGVISFLDSTNLLVLLSSFGLKTPVIISEHTSFDMPKARIFEALKFALYRYASALSVLTKKDRAHYEKMTKNVRVIYNPNPYENAANLSFEKQNLVIFAGRLTELKNVKMFIKVAANLKDTDYKFLIAGSGEERENLENFALSLGAKVEFLGSVSDLAELYKRAKILLSTSRIEGLGNTLIEAVNFDVVRAATKTSGACELITDEFDGILCEQDDDAAMSEAVRALMQDEARRAKICKNAREKLELFSLENIYDQWLELLGIAGVKEGKR